MVETKEKATKPTKSVPVKKSQKVKVLVSVFRVNDKIISAKGIPVVEALVTHSFPKKKLRDEDLFVLASQLQTTIPYSKLPATQKIVENILNNKVGEIVLPELRVNKITNIGTFTHEVLNIEIELLS